ncbi:hypothetical protein [Gemmobacter sp.]|uniref:hypothetical protein n=1 Tax=Gemmobacter sp. TaxID=1898957 RepID=UPI002AFF35DA|nr:hypothetical protein [Gemmobacter sp.]
MKDRSTRLRERFCTALGRLGVVLLLPGLVMTGSRPAEAQAGNAIIVRSDRGGYIGQRDQQISTLRAQGTRVELHGTCLSSCTMYLSLPNICVAPSATFGFHGPSRNGQPLSPADFERRSLAMARHYREPIRSWYLNQARYTVSGYHQMSGAQLISMGYPSC